MSWRGFFLRAGILSDGKNVAIQTGNLTVQSEMISKGIAPAEITTAGAATLTIAQLLAGFIRRDPTGAVRSDVFPTAALMVAGIENVFIGATFDFTIENTGSISEIVTLTVGTGITLNGTMTIAGQSMRRFRAEFTGVASGAQAVTIRRLGAGDEALSSPSITQIDSSALYALGARYVDEAGSVFIYLQGIASVITGNWVTYRVTSTSAAVTKRAVAGDQGTLAIAMAAIVAAKFGWFQLAGLNLGAGAISGGDAAAGGAVYLTATASLMDDVEVADDRVSGAVFSVQEGELASNPAALAGVTISYPFVGMGWPVRPTLSQIDNSALYSVGRTYKDETNGDEWIYLSGVTNCIEGSWLTYYITSIAASVTALLAANAIGLVAIAVGANENSKFGWAQIFGNNLRARATTGGDAAAGAIVYRQADGICDDQAVAGDMVYGAIWSIQEGELAGNPAALAGVTIHYPFVTDEST